MTKYDHKKHVALRQIDADRLIAICANHGTSEAETLRRCIKAAYLVDIEKHDELYERTWNKEW